MTKFSVRKVLSGAWGGGAEAVRVLEKVAGMMGSVPIRCGLQFLQTNVQTFKRHIENHMVLLVSVRPL